MAKVTIILPTHNRPELLSKAINSALNQSYRDFEIIVVDDGIEKRAEKILEKLHDPKIRYIQHQKSIGGAAARNTGIKNAKCEFIAFLDDDDEWLPDKLEIQMKAFEQTPPEVGFCFSAIIVIYDNEEKATEVKEGIMDFHKIALTRFKGFLTSTLIVKKYVFEDVGFFDEDFPSHQEAELILRITKKYKGLGINQPLVKTLMTSEHEHINKDLKRRIAGRELIIKKHFTEFLENPKLLAKHYFWLGLWYRDDGQFSIARSKFKEALKYDIKILYLRHYLSLLFNGRIYKIFRNAQRN